MLPFVSSIVFGAGAWNLVNGVLHDLFVLRSEHGRQYDRNLLRLLMDGHVLITCGAILMIASRGMSSHPHTTYYIAGIALLSITVYCIMIFPFLKSFVTLLINSLTLVFLIISLIKN